MLLGNGSVLLKSPGRFVGCVGVAGYPEASRGSKQLAMFFGGVSDLAAIPDGYGLGTGAWSPAIKTGNVSARFQARGVGAASGQGAGGYGAVGSAAGACTVAGLDTALALAVGALAGTSNATGSAGALVPAVGSAAGAGTMSGAASAVVNAIGTAAGAGALTGFATALAHATGSAAGAASAIATALRGFSAVGSAAGVGSAVGVSSAIAHAQGTITMGAPVDPLSPTALAAAVWNAFVAEFQTAGSFGEAIGQGSAGLTAQQIRDAMKLAASAGTPATDSVDQLLLDIYRILGLDPTRPLVVTAAARTAGAEIEQTIVEAPAGTVTVTRQ